MNPALLSRLPAGPGSLPFRWLNRVAALVAVGLIWAPLASAETVPVSVPMTAEHWTVSGEAAFEPHLGMAAAVLRKGVMDAKGVTLADGTIEFDVDPVEMGAGVGFRHQDSSTFESVYLRPRPMKPDAKDGIQYAPQIRGALLWDLFPQYRGYRAELEQRLGQSL